MMAGKFNGTRSVTAHFDDAAKAERAILWLRRIGVRDDQIRQTFEPAPEATPAQAEAPRKKRRSLMDSFVDFVFPDDPPQAATTGPCSVAVTDIEAEHYDKVVSVLNEEGRVKLDARKADIADAGKITGFIGACLVDTGSGLLLASEGGGALDLKTVAALNADALRTKQEVVEQLGLNQRIEDILITLDKQVHLIRPLERDRTMFVHVALDKATSNLGMARLQLKAIEARMEV